jgi:hypothetical protein
MMRMQPVRSLYSSAAAGAILLGALVIASPAQADIKGGVDVSLAGRVASNPFNQQNPGGAVVSASPSADPWLTYDDPDTMIGLRGNVVTDRYSGNYGTTTTGLLNVTATQKMSSRLSLNGNVSYANSNNATNAFLAQSALAPGTTLPIGTPLPDVSVVGLRVKTEGLNGRLGASYALSEYDSLSVNVLAGMTRTNLSGTSDYNNLGGGLSYSRQLSPRTSAQISVQVNKVDYLRTSQGDGTIYNPSVGLTHKFSPGLELQANVGVSISQSKTFTGADLTSTSFAGNFQLCDKFRNGTLCARVARAAQPSVLGGITVSNDAALSYDRTIGQFTSVSASVHYGRNSQGALAGSFTQDILGVQLNYARSFSRRFSVFVTPSYSKIFDNIAPRGSDVEVRAGVKYRFGAIQ